MRLGVKLVRYIATFAAELVLIQVMVFLRNLSNAQLPTQYLFGQHCKAFLGVLSAQVKQMKLGLECNSNEFVHHDVLSVKFDAANLAIDQNKLFFGI